MDLLKHWELVDPRFEFIYKLFLVQAVLEQAFEAVEFDDIVVSEQLLELFVFVPESAHAPEVAVLTVVERATFSLLRGLVWLLLNHWMVVRTSFAKPAIAVLQPVIANFTPHRFCLERMATLFGLRRTLTHLSLTDTKLCQTSIEHARRFEFLAPQLHRQEGLGLRQVRLVRSSLELVRGKAE